LQQRITYNHFLQATVAISLAAMNISPIDPTLEDHLPIMPYETSNHMINYLIEALHQIAVERTEPNKEDLKSPPLRLNLPVIACEDEDGCSSEPKRKIAYLMMHVSEEQTHNLDELFEEE